MFNIFWKLTWYCLANVLLQPSFSHLKLVLCFLIKKHQYLLIRFHLRWKVPGALWGWDAQILVDNRAKCRIVFISGYSNQWEIIKHKDTVKYEQYSSIDYEKILDHKEHESTKYQITPSNISICNHHNAPFTSKNQKIIKIHESNIRTLLHELWKWKQTTINKNIEVAAQGIFWTNILFTWLGIWLIIE